MDYVGTEKNRAAGRRRCIRFMVSVITSFFIIMSGCTYKKDSVVFVYREAKSISTQMITYFKEKDVGKLKSLFSNHIQKEYDLDTQIKEAFDFIGGDIVSHDEPYGQAGEKSRDIWGTEYEEMVGEVTSVRTDKDRIYGIYFFAYRTYRYDKDYEGVFCMMIFSENEENKGKKFFIGNLDE